MQNENRSELSEDEILEFANLHLNDNLIERDYHSTFSRELWKKCAELGLQGQVTSTSYGGLVDQIDLERAVRTMERFGYACRDNGLSLALSAQMFTVQIPLETFGTAEQKERFLPAMCKGDLIGAHAITELNAGSDVFSMQSTAEKTEEGYILNGEKHLITLAPEADFAVVFASHNPELRKWGLSAFLVTRDLEGIEFCKVQEKMGLRTVPLGKIKMKDALVPMSNRLGNEGSGFSILNHSLEYDRGCILASQVGTMRRQLEETIEFVKQRKQFGSPIAKFQSVSNRIVDMKCRLEMARLLLFEVARLKQHGQSASLQAAMLKLHISESFLQSSIDAVRNRGGSGFLTEVEIERDLRDAVGGVLYAGTSDIQRNIIAKLLGL